MTTHPRRSFGFVFAVVLGLAPAALAHDVIVEQRVEMAIHPSGDRLRIQMRVPVSAIPEAKLSVVGETADAASVERALQVVAADAARNLDVWHEESAVPPSGVAAQFSPDRRAVEIELTYPTADVDGFSARVNAFTGTPLQPVRTIVEYVPRAGPPQSVSVAGPARRIAFDPDLGEAVAECAARALSAVLSAGDHLLWLLCVLLPLRSARQAAQLIGVQIAGQMVVIAASLAAPVAFASAAGVAGTIAASALVMAALQNVVRARGHWVVALTAAFGVLNGFAFGGIFADVRPLAGSHPTAVAVAFVSVVALGQVWVAAVVWGVRAWLAKTLAADRIAVVVASAAIAHSAVHRLIDRGHALAQDGAVGADRVLLWVTLGWASVMLFIAAAELVEERRAAARAHRVRPRAQE